MKTKCQKLQLEIHCKLYEAWINSVFQFHDYRNYDNFFPTSGSYIFLAGNVDTLFII